MVRNVGQTDSTVRLVVGALVAVLGASHFFGVFRLGTGTVGILVALVLLVVGLVLVWTARTKQCPVYKSLDMSTFGDEGESPR